MGQRVELVNFCDWCAAAKDDGPAAEQRAVAHQDQAKPRHLCTTDALLYDLIAPRLEYVRARLAAWDEFVAGGPLDDHRVPPAAARQAQALQDAAERLALTPSAPTAQILPLEVPRADVDIPEAPYVLCGDCEPPAKVDYANREKHAWEFHNCQPRDVPWYDGNVQLKLHVCTAHDACDETSYGFATAEELQDHLALNPPDYSENADPPDDSPTRGHWLEGVDQVGCPEPHFKPGAPTPYWVSWTQRPKHAEWHKKKVHEIAWFAKPGDPFQLDHRCPERGCNNMGFPTPHSLEHHRRAKHARKKKKA